MSGDAKALWLINQYPKVSHSFIQREIAAIEAQGIIVDRVSIRGTPPGESHPRLAEEAARTHVVLAQGGLRLIADTVAEALRGPAAFWRALRTVWSMGRKSPRGRAIHLIYLAEAAHIARRCRAGGIRHIHAHFGTNSTTVALAAARLTGLPYSFTVHGPEEFDGPEALSLGPKADEAAFAVAISRFGAAQISRWAPGARISVVRCGIDLALFDAEAGPDPGLPEAPNLVCVGRLSEQKGHLVLIEAAAELARTHPHFRLTLVGDGELRPQVEAQIAARGLSGHIAITGWADEAAVRDAIRASRALVLSSFAEGLPVVIMEAFALHRPVIATWVAGIPELVDPSNGWLVPAGDAAALASAMATVLDAPAADLARMGAAGRRAVEAQHDLRAEAARLADLIRASG